MDDIVREGMADMGDEGFSPERQPETKPGGKPGTKKAKRKILRVTLYVDRDSVVLDFDNDTSVTLPTTHNGKPAPGVYPVRYVDGKWQHNAQGTVNEKGFLIQWNMPKDATFAKTYTLRVVADAPGGGGRERQEPRARRHHRRSGNRPRAPEV